MTVLTGTATHPGRLTCAPFTSTVPPLGTGVTFTVKETAWCASDGLGDADSVVCGRRNEADHQLVDRVGGDAVAGDDGDRIAAAGAGGVIPWIIAVPL